MRTFCTLCTFALIVALICCTSAAGTASFAKSQDYAELALAESSIPRSRSNSNPHSKSLSGSHSRPASQKIRARLPQIAREAMAFHFGDHSGKFASAREFIEQFEVPPNFKQSRGLFITLSKNGKTRACWGSTTADYPDLVSATAYTTFGALQKEYRFPKIKRQECKDLDVQVTVIDDLRPVGSWRAVNPLRDGMFVRNGGRAAIILPGEAVDAYYQFVLCKLKAGISSKQQCQIYRVKCDVYH